MVNFTSRYIFQILDDVDVTGLIVVTPTVNPIEPTVRLLQKNGAIAVVLAHDGIGKNFSKANCDKFAFHFALPIFEIF
jgi:hypothetical protein